MIADIDTVRRDWEDGFRRLELASHDRVQADRLQLQFDAVSAELRRRVGGSFSLAALVEVYMGSDVWVRQAIEEHAATPGWPRSASLVGDAAFHVYARGAVDYAP